MTTIKAIDTIYKDYKFRSRLEARWAVFMDVLGVQYDYEPEGFDLPEAGYYLPDFWLPDLQMWLEIKPDASSHEEKLRASKLAEVTGQHVVILEGRITTPVIEYYAGWVLNVKESTYQGTVYYGSLDTQFTHGNDLTRLDTLPEWLRSAGADAPDFDGTMECARLLKRLNYEVVLNSEHSRQFAHRHRYGLTDDKLLWLRDREGQYCLKTESIGMYGWLDGKLPEAYTTAQQARFEHGATPKARN